MRYSATKIIFVTFLIIMKYILFNKYNKHKYRGSPVIKSFKIDTALNKHMLITIKFDA